MNDNDIYSVDFTRSLPPPLKNDPEINALGRVIAEQLQISARQIRQNIIYARIDELDEQTLDILAYDLHVDWYDYSHPIAAKRAVIKNSVRVHKRLGTVYAVRTALGSVYPESELEEWFEYGGEHHRFRVVLDVTNSRAPADYVSIKKAISFYKRLSAQMEYLIYQCRVDVQIVTDSDKYPYLTGHTGRRRTGTFPRRNTLAALTDADIAVMPDGGGGYFISPAAGTQPQRAVIAALRESAIQASGEGAEFSFSAAATGKNRAGEKPGRSTVGAVQDAQITAQAETDAYTYANPAAGTQPQRAVAAALRESVIQASGEGVQFSFGATATGKNRAGEKPGRTTGGAVQSAQIAAQTTADGYTYESPEAGTQPQRAVNAALRESAVQASGEGAQFSFKAAATGEKPGRSTVVEVQGAQIAAQTGAGAYTYASPQAGKAGVKPHRSATAGIVSAEVEAHAAAGAYRFTSPQAGAQPGKSTTAEGKLGGIIPEVTGAGYVFRVKRCGTDRCKDR